jgi:hypothetical protein
MVVLLQAIVGVQDDRHEVSPALKLLFSAEDVSQLSAVYRQLRETPAAEA